MLKKIFLNSSNPNLHSNGNGSIHHEQLKKDQEDARVALSAFSIFPLDIWVHVVIPLLAAMELSALSQTSRWFYKNIGENFKLWRPKTRSLVESSIWYPMLDTKEAKELLRTLPEDSPLWRRLFFHISAVFQQNPKLRFCATECGRWRKNQKDPSYRAHSIPLNGLTTAVQTVPQIPPLDKKKHVGSEIVVLLLGPGGIGCKSALAVRYVTGTFVEKYDPTIEDSYRKAVEIDGVSFTMEIIDTAGQSEYSALITHYCKQADGFLLGYSVTSRTSQEDYARFLTAIRETEHLTGLGAPTRPIVLIGNKIDMERERGVTFESGVLLAERIGAQAFIEMSVKNNINCNLAFETITRLIFQYREAVLKFKSIKPKHLYDKSKLANPPDSGGSSFLHQLIAADPLEVDLIRKVLEASPYHVVHWRDNNFRTPLHLLASRFASGKGDLKKLRYVVKMLLDHGADSLAISRTESLVRSSILRGTEIGMLLQAHLEGKVRWELNRSNEWEWVATGPFFAIPSSRNVTYRNGVTESQR